MKQLYINTGKGGVGKSTFSLAMVNYLKANGKNVLYNNFEQRPNDSILSKLNIECLKLDLKESVEIYVARKLNSELLAGWIMKTKFFQSLIEMLPGLTQMIYLGHIIDILKKDKNLIIVIDAPSSGHALTMLKSPQTFKKIFKVGPLVEDIEKMISFLQNKELSKANIVCLPSLLASEEGPELKREIEKENLINSELIMNDCYFLNDGISKATEKLPDFISKRVELEKELFKLNSEISVFPHIASNDKVELVRQLTPYMKELL